MHQIIKKMKNLFFYITIFSIAACGGGGTNNSGAGNEISGPVKIDGSSTVYPITEAVAEEIKHEYPKIRVTIGVSGTGGGFKKFSRGETDINNASRNIKQEEIDLAKENNIEYTSIEIAYDGLAVVVHPENDWVDYLTVAELKMMWEPEAQEKIKRWNQIRPEWPDKEIRLFGAGVESGTYDYFTEAVVGKSHSSRGDFTASEDDNILVQGVSSDKYALAFFGFAYYEQNQGKLKIVPIDGGKGNGAVIPSIETVKNKTYAPLSRPLFLYVNSKAAARPEVQAFISFYLNNAPILVREVGYIPLTDEEYEREKEKFKNFEAGLSASK